MPSLILPRTFPESQGISSTDIFAFIQEVELTIHELHSFMLLRRGQVLAEGWWSPYRPERPHMLFSLSKSFTSTAVGLCAAEGRLSIDDFVLSFFPEEAPAQPDANLKKMRVHHLLCMSTGHAVDSTQRMVAQPEGNFVKGFLSLAVENEPGAPFVYNSGASYMLSAIVQKVTGQTVLEYLQPRLFDPLGIQDAEWESCPRGINMGGWGLSIKTEDIARFGQLYLQKGLWNGARILPEAWVQAATSAQADNSSEKNPDWQQGYGYQFWRCRHNAYRGDGAFGQYCIVMPDQEAVIAITSGVGDMQAVLDLIWKHLLPALKAAPLAPNPSGQADLAQKLTTLALDPPAGKHSSPLAGQISTRKYALAENELKMERISFEFSAQGCRLTARVNGQEQHAECAYGQWKEGLTTLFAPFPRRVAASGVWKTEDTFVITLRSYETPFYHTLTCCFGSDELRMEVKTNVSFGPIEYPPLTGKAVSD